VRRTPALLAASALLVAGLAGCAAAPGDGADCAPSTDVPSLASVDVSGDVGTRPDVEMRTPFHIDDTTVRLDVAGDGPAVSQAGQIALIDLTVYSGRTGEPIAANNYDDPGNAQASTQIAQLFPGLTDAFECVREGSRITVGLSPEGVGEQSAAQYGLGADQSAVAVIDVEKVYLARADGADQFVESHGLPTVVRAPDGRPGIVVPDATAPDELVVQTLKRGDGAELTAADSGRVHYTEVGWDSRSVAGTSWDGVPVSTLDGTLPAEVVDALVGETVGSQLLVVVPGDAEQQAEVYVIDILGIDG
jgi:hypothetical protein